MDMTILDSLGGQAAVIKTGEGPQLSLTPDAETLALFAGLFAILQPLEEVDSGQTSPNANPGLDTASPSGGGQPADIARSSLEALPAAARLMIDGLQAPSDTGEQPEMAETVSLAKLLIAAKSLSSDKTPSSDRDDLPVADTKMSPDAELEPQADMTTAKAILARAIEILDDIDSEPAQPVVGAVEADAILPPVSGEELALNEAARIPLGALPSEDGRVDKPAVRMVPQPAPSREFVGPMPAIPVIEVPHRMVVPPAPSPEFVGPMPAVPVVKVADTKMAEPFPSAEFVGPMPAVPLVLTAAPKVVQARPSVEFVGPMPAVPVVLNAAPKMAQTRPSAEFIGPMPAMSTAETPAPVVTHHIPLAQSFSPMHTAPVAAALEIPAHPGLPANSALPMSTEQIPGSTAMPAPVRPVVLQPGSAAGFDTLDAPHSDLDGAVVSRENPSSIKTGSDHGQGAADSVELIKKPKQMMAKAGPRTSIIKPDGQQAATPQAVALSRDINAHAEKAATAASPSSPGSSSTGTSGSAQQSSGTSTVAVYTGQTGQQQTGGQNQSGQGGGHTASQAPADTAPSRDAADRTMLHRLNTANAGWSDTMIKRLTSDLRSGVQTVRIILEPRKLGRLNVDLGLRDGRASIRIAAETAEAASLLAGARGQLGQLFEQSGMRLASFQTSAGGQDAGMDGNGGQQGQTQSDANGKNAGRDQGFSNKLGSADGEIGQPDDDPAEQDFAPRKGESAVLSILA